MADDPSSPATQQSNPQSTPPQPSSSTPIQLNPNPNPDPPLVSLPPPSVSYAPPPGSTTAVAAFPVPPAAPSFRPVPQFSPLPIYQNPGVPPPGVSSGPPGALMPPGAPVRVPQHMMHYQMLQQPMRPYAPMPMPNGYSAPPQGTVPPPGLVRYPSPYPAMLRPGFPQRPLGGIGLLPSVQRPPMLGVPGVRPIVHPVIRPAIPSVTPAEKQQPTVYVGKIAPTVNNDFMLSLLQLCGPVKNWKRPQDPTDGTPRGFGFCEFESAEGVLRALRLLSKFNIDGQELVLNVNQVTREYLEQFVEKKTANLKKLKETQAEGDEKDGGSSVDSTVPPTSVVDSKEDNYSGSKESNTANFGIVTDEDREADKVAMEKLTSLIEERLKSNPLPPPPPLTPGDRAGNSNSELKSRDGDSDGDITKHDASEEKNDEETTSDNKAAGEQDRPETSSPERGRKPDKGRERERDRERDVKQEKEREIERYERETERERIRKEREQKRKIEDAERKYEECVKDWEYREKDKQKQRQYEKEREKDRERKRKREVINEEDDEEEDSRKRWRRNAWEEKRKRRQREKEDDLADRLKEEEEIAEANSIADAEKQLQKLKDELKASAGYLPDEREKSDLAEESCVDSKDMVIEQDSETGSGHENHTVGGETQQNGNAGDESAMISEPQQSGSAPAKKLGFGLVGSGKRTSVPSVFKEEEDDAHKDKKMRPLVPIDYSTEELQAVEPAVSGQAPPNLAAAAEFAKRLSNVGSKEDKYDADKERNRPANDRSSRRDRDRNDVDTNRARDQNKVEKTMDRDTDREHGRDKPKPTDNKKLLDAKQLIDMIPRTKEELFSYKINWDIYEEHSLHERMKPWISKKITEFLGEEETTLVDYIVVSTQQHVGAERMLQLLQSILDEEAEMFVLKMWRMLIFEIKKVETGLASKTRS